MPHIHRRPLQLPLELAWDIRDRLPTPGPGSYTLTSRLKEGVRFTRSPRSGTPFPNIPVESPGCIYKQDSRLVHRSPSPIGFSRSPRDPAYRLDTSGPEYQEARSTLSRRCHSFAASRSAYRAVYYPGFEREKLGRTSRTICTSGATISTVRSGRSFSRSPRSQSRSPVSIGPGHYDPSTGRASIGHAVPFGSPRRRSRLNFQLFSQLSKSYWSM
jgi:hypothetical protein